MQRPKGLILFILVLGLVAGCASTKVTEQTPMVNQTIARPNQIWVYDFVAAVSDVPADSAIRNQVWAQSRPPTSEQIQTGRELGALIATDLVADIQAMGCRPCMPVLARLRRLETV
jgi:hypothetical protein